MFRVRTRNSLGMASSNILLIFACRLIWKSHFQLAALKHWNKIYLSEPPFAFDLTVLHDLLLASGNNTVVENRAGNVTCHPIVPIVDRVNFTLVSDINIIDLLMLRVFCFFGRLRAYHIKLARSIAGFYGSLPN